MTDHNPVQIERTYLVSERERWHRDWCAWVDQIQVASSSSDKVYTVSRKEGTDLYGCSCQGWITHGHCKHLTRLGKESAKDPAAKIEGSYRPTATARLSYTCPVCGHRRGNHLTRLANPGCTGGGIGSGGACDCVLVADDIVADRKTSATIVLQQHRNSKCTNWMDARPGMTVPEAKLENEKLGWDKYRWWRAA